MADFVFDRNHYMNNLDKVVYYTKQLPVGNESKFQSLIKKIKTSCLLYFNYFFGDKHWYDAKIAQKVVQGYVWESRFDSVVDSKIFEICQELQQRRRTDIDQRAVDFARKVCSPLPDASEKVLFHIHGDEFGLGSELEGAKSSDLIEYIEKFLTARKEQNLGLYHIDENLLEEIRTAMLLSFSIDTEPAEVRVIEKTELGDLSYIKKLPPDFLDQAKQKLMKTFETGKPLLLPGGWVGKPSEHAMYYEIIPQKDGKANFRLYNLGEDGGHHPQAIIKGKVKVAPYTEWTGIDFEKFLSINFLQAIYEMRKMSEYEGVSTDYNTSDSYQALREFLEPEGIKDNIAWEEYKSGQRAGTCTFRSLLAFLATRMDREDFKRLVIDLQFHSLTNRVAKNPSPSRREVNLIKKAHQKLSRKTQKAYAQQLIDKNDLASRAQALSTIKKYFKSKQHVSVLSSPSLKTEHYQKPAEKIPETLSSNTKTILHKQILQEEIEVPIPQPHTQYYSQLKELKASDRPLKEQLNLAEKICQEALADNAHEALELGLVEWVLSLSSELDQLKQECNQDPNQMKSAIAALGRISQLFFKNCF